MTSTFSFLTQPLSWYFSCTANIQCNFNVNCELTLLHYTPGQSRRSVWGDWQSWTVNQEFWFVLWSCQWIKNFDLFFGLAYESRILIYSCHWIKNFDLFFGLANDSRILICSLSLQMIQELWFFGFSMTEEFLICYFTFTNDKSFAL